MRNDRAEDRKQPTGGDDRDVADAIPRARPSQTVHEKPDVALTPVRSGDHQQGDHRDAGLGQPERHAGGREENVAGEQDGERADAEGSTEHASGDKMVNRPVGHADDHESDQQRQPQDELDRRRRQ
jgi:hypothetical protein